VGQYDWVADKKRKAMMQKLQRRGMPKYAQLPISQRYGVSFAGYGNDGVLQKNNVAGIDATTGSPHAYHEGEVKLDTPEGSTYITADIANLAGMNMKGYASGGFNTKLIKDFQKYTGGFNIKGQEIPTDTGFKKDYNVKTQEITPAITRDKPTVTPMILKGQEIPTTGTDYVPAITRDKPTVTPMTLKGQEIPTVTEDATTKEDDARGTGLDYLTKTLTEDSGTQLAGQKALDELRLRHQQEQSAARQRAIQSGYDPGRVELAGQQLRAQQETESNDLAAQYGIASAQEKASTAATLASQGLSGQQFEQEKMQYGNTEGWRAYEAAIAAGDYNTAAQAYKKVTGNDISMDQMQTYQGYLNKKQQIDLSDTEYQSVQNRISTGATLEQINSELGTNLTPQEYASMLEASALGERNWSRKASAATMLLATKGATNKEAAAKIYSEIFPGVDFDFSSIITEEKSGYFSSGMTEMSDYVIANMKTDDAILAMKKSGALTKMGITEDEARQLYNGIKVNAVDAEWDEVENSKTYQGMTTEEQNNMREFFKQSMTGQLDYNTLKEYEIYDGDSLKTVIYGKDTTEADKYAKEHGYTVKDTGKVKFQVASTIVETGETTNTEKTDSEKYNEFLDTLPDNTTAPSFDTWKEAKNPENYDDYWKTEKDNPAVAIKEITDTGKDLLNTENSKTILAAFKADPEKVKEAGYYFEMPDAETLGKVISSKNEGLIMPKRVTTFSGSIRSSMEAAIGKVVNIPWEEGEGEDNIISGQLVSVEASPTSVVAKVQQENGKIIDVPIYYLKGYDMAKGANIYIYNKDTGKKSGVRA